jgi:hypothetical protein
MSKNTVSKKNPTSKAEVILLGLDIHAERQVAVRQIDGHKKDDMGLGLAVRPPIRQSVESTKSNT